MLKRRLIFTLLLAEGTFQLSRNFSLQGAGDLDWLYANYSLQAIAHSIDELVLLDVGREERSLDGFAETLRALSERCFMPITAGGGIRSIEHAYRVLAAGADKLVVNTVLADDPDFVRELAGTFGSQAVVASIDYRRPVGAVGSEVYVANGTRATGTTAEQAVARAVELGAGEVYLTSIERDGTGQGYDLELLERVSRGCRVPVIASGGVGDFEHFLPGLRLPSVTGASTANIFNFLGDGLLEAREHLRQGGIEMALWDFASL